MQEHAKVLHYFDICKFIIKPIHFILKLIIDRIEILYK